MLNVRIGKWTCKISHNIKLRKYFKIKRNEYVILYLKNTLTAMPFISRIIESHKCIKVVEETWKSKQKNVLRDL